MRLLPKASPLPGELAELLVRPGGIARLAQVVRDLPDRERSVFVLRVIVQAPMAEIAERYKITAAEASRVLLRTLIFVTAEVANSIRIERRDEPNHPTRPGTALSLSAIVDLGPTDGDGRKTKKALASIGA